MQKRILLVVVGIAAILAACATAEGTPATVPSASSPPPTRFATTSTTSLPPTMSATSTTPPSTTLAPQTTTTLDRIAEIHAILKDLERRRLDAFDSGDTGAVLALLVEGPYKDEARRLLPTFKPGDRPELETKILKVLADDAECLVVVESTSVVGSNDLGRVSTVTLQPLDGGWGYAYVFDGVGDWLCTEPHPLSQ